MRADGAGCGLAYDDPASVALIESLAHHVRSPLAGVSGALHILRERARLRIDERLVLDEVLARVRELTGSMECLIQLAGPLELRRQAVSLVEIVRERAAHVAALSARDIHVTPSDDEVLLSIDPRWIGRALEHLLRNAVEAGGAAAVAVRIRLADDVCHLDVVDRGEGWPSHAWERRFEPFVTTKSRHLGIGLAITRRIVRAHGGTVDCLDTGSRGTAMVMHLPRRRGNPACPASSDGE